MRRDIRILQYNLNNRKLLPNHAFLHTLLVVLMMVLGSANAWGQGVPVITTDENSNGVIDEGEKKLYLIQTNQFQSFYMIPKDGNVTTYYLPDEKMLWYFLDAGIDGGVQYYYIISNYTGNCIYNYNGNSRGIQLTDLDALSAANKEKCKFKLVVDNSNGTTGFYNIDVKASQTYFALNKQNGSVNNSNYLRLTNSQYVHDYSSKWKFIPYDGTYPWAAPPFTLSTDLDKHYYKIRNKQDNSYYVSTNTATPRMVTYATAGANRMAWYFKEAATDPSGYKYYYIINPEADQYMYYQGTATDGSKQNNAFKLATYDSGDEDRYQFIVVQSAKTGAGDAPVECYAIIPKLLRDQFWDKCNSLGPYSTNNNTNMGILNSRNGNATNYAQWTFETTTYPMACATPVISFDFDTKQVTITTETVGATIYYTTDGSTPTTSSTPYNPSSKPTVSSTTTIKAIAALDGVDDSPVAELTITAVATPTISKNGSNQVEISCATEGATLYYTTDGSTPTTSSTVYTTPLKENVSGVTIKVLAVKEDMLSSTTSGSVTLDCEPPIIKRGAGNTFVILPSFPSTATIHYTYSNGPTPSTPADPTAGSATYSSAVSCTYPVRVKAIAVASGYNNSSVAYKQVEEGLEEVDGVNLIQSQKDFETFIDMVNSGEGAGLKYKLTTDVSGSYEINVPFTGTFDGGLQTISGLGHALFNTVNGGTVKNVILEDVSITSGTNVGAICNEATGDSRIYNCGVLPSSTGSSISGSGDVGSIVGLLDGTSRVINCYSYATVNGGSHTGGIVGNNNVATNANSEDTDHYLKTMVMNCMFYGNITGGSNISPVYGGELIDNAGETGINNYNYYRRNSYDRETDTYIDDVAFDNNMALADYHRSWPADVKYLTRFEYYRSILNSNKKLCTWWVKGTNKTAPTDEDIEEVGIAKWVLDPAIAPYPILKKWGKYPSVINQDPDKRIDPSTKTWVDRANASANWGEPMAPDTEGQKLGTVTVTIIAGAYHSGSETRTIPITAMDTLYHDYCYGKIQLPYYNEIFGNPEGNTWEAKYGGNYTAHVVTGWDISGGSAATGYNFADRNSYSGRVYAQGGYFYVPEGVTSITITAHWADAVYLCNKDYSIDRVDVATGVKAANGSAAGKVAHYGSAFTPAGTIPTTFQGQAVYTTVQEAIGHLSTASSGKDVYNQAIVLIGNVQVRNHSYVVNLTGNNAKPFTLMSADLDFDNEPDNCLELQFRNDIDRPGVQPIRFDFLPVPELGLAIRTNKLAYAIGIMIPLGHFEITETAYFHTTQFEYDANVTRNGKSPVIINGGEHEMFTVRKHASDRTSYFLLGGNAWLHRFAPGAHPNTGDKPNIYLCPINVIGGEIKELYLSGLYRPELPAPANQGNPYCFIDGGKFGTVAGAGYDKVSGPVTFKIDHSLIGEFYGGGINGSNPIGGNIDVTINNSQVGKYCGGPKVGDMSGKTVTTSASGTTFGVFYGGGNGGNSYYRQLQRDGDMSSSHIGTWTNESYNWNGFSPVATYYDDASEAGQTGKEKKNENKGYHAEYEFEVFNQSNGLSDEITQRGFIQWIQFGITTTGDVESTLQDCKVLGNFYGGGNLANVSGSVTSTLNNTQVDGSVFGAGYSAAIPTFQVHDKNNKTFPSINDAGVITDGNIPYTATVYEWTNDLNGASVSDRKANPTYQKNGKWYCYTWNSLENLGAVTGKVTLNLEGTTTIAENVYGGGESSDAESDVEVNMNSGTVTHDVYGGGALAHTNTANWDTSKNEGAGGWADGKYDPSTGTTYKTAVNLNGGTVRGDVYGGGLGRKDDPDPNKPDVAALVEGDVTVTVNGTQMVSHETSDILDAGRVFGANNINGTPRGHVKVLVKKTAAVDGQDIDVAAVFGGGNMASYTPANANDYAEVEINKTPADGRLIVGDVFGGGNQAGIGNSTTAAGTQVNIMAGEVKTGVYGGSNTSGTVTGDVLVTLTGGTIGTDASHTADVFGGGYGEPTLVNGNVTVNIGTPGQATAGAIIYGNVYGGGALGSVNASKPESALVFDATKETDVNLLKGTINGDAYGGGLGQKNGVNGATSDVESFVGGDVNVLLNGAKIPGRIFGCNNLNGTPKGHVKVWVKKTEDNDKSSEEALNKTRDERTTYDVAAVYGGGNQADYVPTNATLDPAVEGNPAKIAAACAEVIIEGCDETSIQYVYGGGNAAAVPATDVTIKGSYIIDYLFGGGNGAGYMDPPTNSIPNPGANVGIYDHSSPKNYGTGKAVTKLYAGKVHVVYGGSNTKGNVRGGTSISMPQLPVGAVSPEYCSALDVREIYGAGQNAEQDGGVAMVLGCVTGLENVYGGARDAHVKGGVDLVITSGHFTNVFGGNDNSGTIQGPITVTIEETGCEPVEIDNLYLGGNNAAYSVYGYKDVSGTLTARTKAEYDAMTTEQKTAEGLPYANPVLNVVSCTSIGNVFGGGYGITATMYGSPTVNINMIPGEYARRIDRDNDGDEDNDATAVGTIGNVYGGGNAADVIGDTHINICTESTAAVRTNMGAEIPVGDRTPVAVQPAYITGDVFGAGKGDPAHVEYAKVTGSTTIIMGNGTVKQSVYGGGELSQVTGDTHITVSGGTIGTPMVPADPPAEEIRYGGEKWGNIYGGGKGNTTNVRSGLIMGNTNITVSNGTILHNIYGGGAHGSVGTYTYTSDAADAAIDEYTTLDGEGKPLTGVATITITGGTFGYDGHNNGMIFGSSRGDIDEENTIYDNVAWVYDTHVNIGTENDATSGPTIWGSVYGSGENGHTYHDTEVMIYSGTIGDLEHDYPYRGNVYGGGCGTDKYYSDPSLITGTHTAHDGEGDTYNRNAGIVKGDATVTINGGSVANNVYGAGSMGKVLGSTSVTINTDGVIGVDGNHDDGNVYGAARGELGLADDFGSVTNSSVTLTNGTVKGSLYGGGKAGPVNGAVTVSITGGTVNHDVYGGGALAKTNTSYDSSTHPDYVTTVSQSGGTIIGILYGGGLGRQAGLYVAEDPEVIAGTKSVGDEKPAVAADVKGTVTVTVSGEAQASNVFGCNNLNGAPQRDVVVNINGGTITNSVFGGGNQAAFGGNTTVNMTDGTVNYNIFGGGNQADVAGSVAVNISGGTVVNDVYGGGALANTNTGNWDAEHSTWKVASSDNTDYYIPVKHLTKDVSVVTGYYTTENEGASYTAVAATEPETKAAEGVTYYKKITMPANIYAVATGGTTYTTSVNATGGVIGNIYGGGLGQLGGSPIAAMVYGDVTVTVNGAAFSKEQLSYNYTPEEAIAYNAGLTGALGSVEPLTAAQAAAYNAAMSASKSADDTLTAEEAAAYNAKLSGAVSTSDIKNVAKTGRVFGCNNLNGTPKGKVLVQVIQTTREDGGSHVDDDYEILAVYGGGNAADYVPQTYDETTEFGQHTRVVINGCTDVSIEKVYGGGNAANVPFTDVLIEGAYQIGYVFGGGNGGDRLYYNDSWHENLGANVIGYANVLTRGGTIGQIFGGSDTRGTVGGAETTQEAGTCPLNIVNWYGAGNGEEATADGDITVNVSGCGAQSSIKKVFGGSYKANVKGSITLNITSGVFTSVYGGNDRMGSIGGNITVNIEETETCGTPIIIQNLFGGCYETPYPGANASTYNGGDKSSPSSYTPFTRGKITVNVKSATRIDKVYGGSYKANVNGDTEVNVNMTKGSCAGQPYELPIGYRGNQIPNLNGVPVYREVTGLTYLPSEYASDVNGYYTYDGVKYTQINKENAKAEDGTDYYEIERYQGTIDDAIGTIGDVFGGGFQGVVNGDAVVNVGTETEVDYATTVTHLSPNANSKYDVRGAHIEHDVFGGGNLANVKGNTEVNICAKDDGTGNYEAVAEGAEKVTIGGSVYGGGNQGDIEKNTHVTVSGGYIFNGIFGGGYSGSVGTFTRSTDAADVNIFGHTSHSGTCLGKPVSCAPNTGLCTVVVNGGQIGPVSVATDGMPVPQGWVWGGGYGLLEDPEKHPDTHFITYVDSTDVTIGGTAFIMEGVIGGGEFGRVRKGTHVTIEGNCQIGVGAGKTETVGGVLKPKRYDAGDFINPTVTPVTDGNALDECAHWPYGEDTNDDGVSDQFNCLPYDPYYEAHPSLFPTASTSNPSDGTTWIGVVYGGGSGYMPYLKEDGTGYDWCRSAGWVEGNTKLEIKGGHILTNVYGANEYTDVGGNAIVRMTGGTIGVPRTQAQILKDPVLGCLFGAGKGDQRTYFNTWTNVQNVDVEVTGGIIYGSVYGGGEEGHVLSNVKMTVGGTAVVGSCGTSYFDGNVFGGGRGYSGRALTAGSVGGNVTLNITGGKMLGSVYGGGRMASVGTYFANVDDTRYGNFKEDDAEGTYGHVTVNISGGEIGNNEPITKPHTTGGNVFGGCMGRLTYLNGTANPHWAQLAQEKTATINITGNSTLIKGNVFGGGEFGTVRDHAYVTIGGTLAADKETVTPSGSPTLLRDVFGGGYGYGNVSEDANYTASVSTKYLGREHIYTYTPMKFAGCVGKSTLVNIAGGWVKKNVYGGGEMASVGIINYETEPADGGIAEDELKAEPDGSTKYMYITKHADETSSFALSWPYAVSYITDYEGTSTVNVTGGRIGITGKDIMAGSAEKIDNGDIYGGCKGSIGERYDVAFCGNVKNTFVNINYTSSTAEPTNYKTGVDYSTKNEYDCIAGSVYGGGEDGHVIGNTSVTLANGLIGHSIYGGGKGKDTYKKTLTLMGGGTKPNADVYSITGGKVYGNTNVTMTDGYVVRNIYGGGNMASVGKGNYAGGADDYSVGYGEQIEGNLWANTDFTGSGITNVSVTGGQVGYIDADPSKSIKDDLPLGNVFGGCRGQAAAEYPGININPDFYVGYVNETDVTVGDGSGGPTIYGSVYGGGQDGHVRRDTKVTINNGEIGRPYTSAVAATALVGTSDINDIQWLHRGNVYGAGSGIGKYEFDYDGNSSTWTDADSDDKYDEGEENSVSTPYGPFKERGFSSSAGSVTRNSNVEIKGGTIHRNVYGGGSLASVISAARAMGAGPYADADDGKASVNTVDVSGGAIGSLADYGCDYGGHVFGASRGMSHADISPEYFALTAETQVNIKNTCDGSTLVSSPHIFGNVYGGGEMGIVKQNTIVQLTGGTIDHDAYGGGKGIKTNVGGIAADVGGIAADVGGNTTVLLNQGVETADNHKGCIVSRIFGCNDQYGTPKGHPLVHVYATQNANTEDIFHKIAPPTYAASRGTSEGYKEYLTNLVGNTTGVGATQTGGLDAEDAVITAATTLLSSLSAKDEEALTADDKTSITNAAKNIVNALEAMHRYDVEAVYGGGDMADYVPTDASSSDPVVKANARTEVIIEGCEVTSINQVYGGSNAASTPATDVKVESVFVIDELFGGGNGKDNYTLENGKWYENPGANVGYTNYMHYVTDGSKGTGEDEENMYEAITNTSPDATTLENRQANYAYGQGEAKTTVTGGHIHKVYGGSNEKGNIRKTALSQYQKSGSCALLTDETYGGSKNAEIDAEIEVVLDCVESTGDFFGGSMNANINSNVTVNITNGTYGRIFGGNNKTGTINGDITINIEEKGCTPIIIGELYGGGYLAPYSVYGFQKDGEGHYVTVANTDEEGNAINSNVPLKKGQAGALDEEHRHRDPFINIISATEIGNIFGGGYKAQMIASPHINVNMTTGRILEAYKDKDPSYASLSDDADGNKILPIGTIGNIYGGGNQADVLGDTHVEIGTGTRHNVNNGEEETIEPARNAANITGIVYGGGKFGHVGDFTLSSGKPVSCAEGTGTCYVTVSNGTIGPDGMQMTAAGGPDDAGHVFGGGQGTVDLYFDDTSKTDEQKQTAIAALDEDELEEKKTAVNNLAYVNNTEVVINGEAFVKGGVYGGGFDGHVLGDTHVTIDGNCQIGCGRSTNDRHPAAVWEDDYVPSDLNNLECASWPYGIDTDDDGKPDTYAPHDKFANATGELEQYADGSSTNGGRRVASDGHSFYGNVFGGGSGYYPYAPGKWLHKSGWVEGNTLLEIKGGHILTNAYGGNEMTNVGDGLTADKGKCTIRMTGGTIGVPRTLTQIAAHPVTCYLFGAGKGDQIIAFNTETNVKEVEIEITGGRIYGSVFGGGEDGHVLGDVKMTIDDNDDPDDDGSPEPYYRPTKIGTWGTSYVDGNVFGGGRGYSGNALTAGNVGGSIDLDIKGGTMLGSIFGGGRLGSVGYGLYAPESSNYGVMRDDDKDDAGTATDYYTSTGMNKKGRGYVDINISGGTIGNGHEFIIPDSVSAVAAGIAKTNFKNWEASDWTTWKNFNNVPKTEFDTSNGRVTHTKGGNVFAGGMGRRLGLDESTTLSRWKNLGNVKSTKLTISGGDTWIMGNVYGGGEFGAVMGNHDTKNTEDEDIKTGTEIIITGGTIGTEVTGSTPVKPTVAPPVYGAEDRPTAVQYTFGSVYGGGYGTEAYIEAITAHTHVDTLGAYVADSTYINMTTGLVRASVFGGGEIAAVGGSTNVNISGGEIGRNEVYGRASANPGYVRFGSYAMGNVYGGGKGTSSHTLIGVVKGNTTININPGAVEGEPKIYHNVYGGGAYGSVGTFDFSDGETGFMRFIPAGIPLNWGENTGIAIVNIKGGTIGISGRDNGMVNGSARGDVAEPVLTRMASSPILDGHIYKDPYDKMSWVEHSIVNIGEDGEPGPHIKGSVYGGGENGHVFTHATVNVKSGTIGVLDTDPWYNFGNEEINEKAIITRGNVYGAGCGTDTYTDTRDGNKEKYNPWAGCVIANTEVNISGGHVTQNVYGGGSMGAVGRLTNDPSLEDQHRDVNNSFALSWPAKLVYENTSSGLPVGKTTVNITGGRIGTTGSDNGDVFGGTRGIAGNRYEMASFGNVRETEVTIDYPSTPTDANLAIVENIEDGSNKFSLRVKEGVNAITGSVYGGGENGHVYENTKVDIRNGLIGHAIYGGGKGKGTYMINTKEYPSLTAGKVYGNTKITMSGGHVMRNIYGGGNQGSVGKGNYASGTDDYYPEGYGEKIDGNLWDKVSDNSKAFMNSGIDTVNITGGVIGFMADNETDVIPLGGGATTFGSMMASADAGTKKKLLKIFSKDDLPTGNVYGGCRGQAAMEVMDTITNPAFFLGYVNETDVTIGDGSTGPRIYGSVYGGGQDGHVRRGTKVTIKNGEIGIPYDAEEETPVYTAIFGTDLDNPQWLHRGNVYGGGSGIGKYETTDAGGDTIEVNSSSAGSVTHTTTVSINNGINGTAGNTIHRNVYGGGSLASVTPPSISTGLYPDDTGGLGKKFINTVTISGTIGTADDYVTGFKYNKKYGGEVYGASRGDSSLNPEWFALSVWTKVLIKNGANILGNVFGGGDAGAVKKDSEVVVGAE